MSLWNKIVAREKANRDQLGQLKLRRDELSGAKARNRKNIGDAEGALTTLRGERLPDARKSESDVWAKEVKEKRDVRKKEAEWNKKKAENFGKFNKARRDTLVLRGLEAYGIQRKWNQVYLDLYEDIYNIDKNFKEHFSRALHRVTRAWWKAFNPGAFLPTAKFGGNLYLASGYFGAEPPTSKIASLDKKLAELKKNLEEFKRDAKKQDYQFLRAYGEIGQKAFDMRRQALDKVNAIIDRIEGISKQLRQLQERTGYLEGKGKEYAQAEKQLAAEWKMLQAKKAQLVRYMRARRR
jgi:hypothetical protein